MISPVIVAGAGLAGAEAAWQLAEHKIPVRLIDMKPGLMSPAHHLKEFAELVCSNSLRSEKFENASGVLKVELRLLDSLVMKAADACRLPAGNALAVDRESFPAYITHKLKEHPLIRIEEREIKSLSELGEGYRVIATGPLTGGDLFRSIQEFSGEDNLAFFDAAAPLVEEESIDRAIAFLSDRYGDGEGDYLNCPFTKEEYEGFHEALLQAEKAEIKGFEKKLLFSGCQPVEAIAEEGFETLRFGPLKPVGLKDPRNGEEPYAVVQLRRDDFAGSLWNLVGFQTRLKFPEQKRVFRMIPGLESAEFARYGVMHRNSFLCSPKVLTDSYRSLRDPKLFFAGQITGVEGYLESTSGGLLAALQIVADLMSHEIHPALQGRKTVIGGLAAYAAYGPAEHFQPMKANFSVLEPLSSEDIKKDREVYGVRGRGRRIKRLNYGIRSAELLGVKPGKIKEWLNLDLPASDTDHELKESADS